jgi:hypothetical protein
VTSTDSRESSLEKTGGGELDLKVNARSRKGELGGSMVLACGGDDGGIASESILQPTLASGRGSDM